MIYGNCPQCGTSGVSRERRINGYDVCANGHKYLSKEAVYSNTPDVQAAIDAALESVAQDMGGRYLNFGMAAFVRSCIGTNPLAEAQERIAELERIAAEQSQRIKALTAGCTKAELEGTTPVLTYMARIEHERDEAQARIAALTAEAAKLRELRR